MQVLNRQSIIQKIKRLSIQILENHLDHKAIYFIGINNNGYHFAELLAEQLTQITDIPVHLHRVRLNPASPYNSTIELSVSKEDLHDQHIILVDDVANTGRTTFYAVKPLLDILPASLEVAVLVDRTHKSFPIRVDYVGLSLATTLKEHIDVHLQEDDMSVYLN